LVRKFYLGHDIRHSGNVYSYNGRKDDQNLASSKNLASLNSPLLRVVLYTFYATRLIPCSIWISINVIVVLSINLFSKVYVEDDSRSYMSNNTKLIMESRRFSYTTIGKCSIVPLGMVLSIILQWSSPYTEFTFLLRGPDHLFWWIDLMGWILHNAVLLWLWCLEGPRSDLNTIFASKTDDYLFLLVAFRTFGDVVIYTSHFLDCPIGCISIILVIQIFTMVENSKTCLLLIYPAYVFYKIFNMFDHSC
jgi:hypothetical protein